MCLTELPLIFHPGPHLPTQPGRARSPPGEALDHTRSSAALLAPQLLLTVGGEPLTFFLLGASELLLCMKCSLCALLCIPLLLYPAIPNLFGSSDQFRGRWFFHARWWEGGWFGDDLRALHLSCTL